MIAIKQLRPKRGKEILQFVRDHGPVTIDMLFLMMAQTMSKKNLRKALGILRTKKLIDVIRADSQTAYYQISQGLQSRVATSKIVGGGEKELVQRFLRRQDLFHNQWCEYWALVIKQQFPEAEIIREHTIGGHEIAKNVLQVKDGEFDLLPDFLIRFPPVGAESATYIAFEIERTRKSNNRILRKLQRYLNGTKIDGLIYVCDNGRLSETIRQLYRTKLLARSPRVGHYANHFFLFSDSLDGGGRELQRLVNANAEAVSFIPWCSHLRSIKWTKRRDEQFV